MGESSPHASAATATMSDDSLNDRWHVCACAAHFCLIVLAVLLLMHLQRNTFVSKLCKARGKLNNDSAIRG
jgi:hypothetical protein